jgi:hypothetical protein
MIQTPSTDASPVRPSRAAAATADATTRPSIATKPVASRPEGQLTPDTQSRALAQLPPPDAARAGSGAEPQRPGELRRAGARAHVTRRLASLQSMDASMQAALMRISQMRQLAMRAARARQGDGVEAAHAEGTPLEDNATLASVFAQLEKDIELLVEGQLGGYLAANAVEQDAESRRGEAERGEAERRETDGRGPLRAEADAAPSNPRVPRTPRARAAIAKPQANAAGRPSQRVQLQVAASASPEVPAGPMRVEGDLASSDGATALLADLDLLARQISGARASILAALGRLQRDPSEGEPAPVRVLGARRRQGGASSEPTAAAEASRQRKPKPEDPLAAVRARLALAIAAQANTSPEAAVRLL